MVGYNNPEIVLLENPRGIDKKIQDLQLRVSTLPWLDKVFGRAFIQREYVNKPEATERLAGQSTRKREVIYPLGYGIKNEGINLMPNDNLKSYCFFYLRDPQEYEDDQEFGDNQYFMTSPVTMIIWCNLKRIDEEKDFRYFSALMEDLHNKLLHFPGLKLKKSFEQFDKVFQDFTLTETYRQYNMWPYAACRIDFDLTYSMLPENC